MRSWGWTKGLHPDSEAGLGSGLEAHITSSGAGRGWREGSTPQISRAYWAMVRSLENLPDVAMFRITIRVHSLGFYRPKGNSGFILQVGSPASTPLHPSQGHRSPASPWPRTPPYLEQRADFLLTFDIVFIICKDFKPGGDGQAGSSMRSRAKPILSCWTSGDLESDAASKGASPTCPGPLSSLPTRPSPEQPSCPTCPAPCVASSPVVVHEHVDNVLEEVRLFGGEESAAELLDDLPKLRNPIIVLLGIVPVGQSCGQRPGTRGLALSPKKSPEILSPRVSLLLPSLQLPLEALSLSLLCSAFCPS